MTTNTMTSAQCLVNNPAACRGQVISLAYVGPCAGPAHDDDEPIEDVERDVDLDMDMIEFERWAI